MADENTPSLLRRLLRRADTIVRHLTGTLTFGQADRFAGLMDGIIQTIREGDLSREAFARNISARIAAEHGVTAATSDTVEAGVAFAMTLATPLAGYTAIRAGALGLRAAEANRELQAATALVRYLGHNAGPMNLRLAGALSGTPGGRIVVGDASYVRLNSYFGRPEQLFVAQHAQGHWAAQFQLAASQATLWRSVPIGTMITPLVAPVITECVLPSSGEPTVDHTAIPRLGN